MAAESLSKLASWEGGFPGSHEFSDFDGLGHEPWIEEARGVTRDLIEKWQGNNFVGLYLYGSPGTGKTHAAIAAGRALHGSGAEIHYRFVPEMTMNDANSPVRWTSGRSERGIQSSVNSVFPASYGKGVARNPRSVLILDDYRPDWQPHTIGAVEAGTQFGGAIIITSNYPDPFKLFEVPDVGSTSVSTLMAEALVGQHDPEALQAFRIARAAKLAEVTAGLRSKVAAGFRFIEFAGPDHRVQNNFWNE